MTGADQRCSRSRSVLGFRRASQEFVTYRLASIVYKAVREMMCICAVLPISGAAMTTGRVPVSEAANGGWGGAEGGRDGTEGGALCAGRGHGGRRGVRCVVCVVCAVTCREPNGGPGTGNGGAVGSAMDGQRA